MSHAFPNNLYLILILKAKPTNKTIASKTLFLQWPCEPFDSEYQLTAYSFTQQFKATKNIYVNWEPIGFPNLS